MMDEKNEGEKNIDDFMLPGFRFHPTDEELVGFYLKRKLQHRPLPIELIKQVDIYKYDPWDLPKLASTGEKEWYFYCPRDRKYRNSTRPNRVTGSGFWKATGTDRPIYSSDGTKCIGLKKSLVFYRGRAAKGIKTDWMMHEFRLPTTTVDSGGPPPPPKKISDKNFPATDSWAICRIFKKTNSIAQRALSHSWAASLSETSPPDAFNFAPPNHTHFNSENISSTTENEFQNANFSALNIPSYKTGKPSIITSSNGEYYFPGNHIFSSPEEVSNTTYKSTVDFTSMFFNLSSPVLAAEFENPQPQFSINSSQMMQTCINAEDEQLGLRKNQNIHNPWGNIRSMGFPFSLPSGVPGPDAWKQTNLPWDSPTCPSELSSTTFSTDKCYT